jgi:hypothetical protein
VPISHHMARHAQAADCCKCIQRIFCWLLCCMLSLVQSGLINCRFSDDDPHIVASMSGRKVHTRRGKKIGDRALFYAQFVNHFPQLTHELFVTEPMYTTPGTYDVCYQWASSWFTITIHCEHIATKKSNLMISSVRTVTLRTFMGTHLFLSLLKSTIWLCMLCGTKTVHLYANAKPYVCPKICCTLTVRWDIQCVVMNKSFCFYNVTELL